MVPPTIVLVPNFLVVSELGLLNSLWGVIWPAVATPTGVFLLRQYMLTLPDELLEAARMDHASEWRIYWRIVLPLTAPALAVLAIFSVMWRWNDFLWPLVVLSKSEKFTLQLALNAFQGDLVTQWNYLLAMTVLTLLPVTVVFAFLQKYITRASPPPESSRHGHACHCAQVVQANSAPRAVIHGVDLDGRRRRVRGVRRAVGLRQVDAAAPDLRARSTSRAATSWIDGKRVNDVSAADRGLAMVFQSYALYPHMTVRQNMAFGLENIGTPRAEIDSKVRRAAKLLQLDALLDAAADAALRRPAPARGDRPRDRARAAHLPLRRAAVEPRRRAARVDAHRDHGAARAARDDDDLRHARPGRGDDDGRQDRRAARGRVEQVGAPLDLYNAPANRFVAGFIGSPQMNFVPARVVGRARRRASRSTLARRADDADACRCAATACRPATTVTLGVRPEHLALRRRRSRARSPTIEPGRAARRAQL